MLEETRNMDCQMDGLSAIPSGTPKTTITSVVITYFNEGDMLLRAIKSVGRQENISEFEVVVVDDCSEIPPIIPSEIQFPIRLVRSEFNIGASASRNLGVANSSGEYICFLDADDEYLPGKLASQIPFLEAHPEVMVVGAPWYLYRDGHETGLVYPDFIKECFPELLGQACVLPDQARVALCVHYGFQTGATTYRRSAFEAVGGFEEGCRWGEETDLLIRIAEIGRIGYVPEPAERYLWRSQGSITSTTNPEKFIAGARLFRKWRRSVGGLSRKDRCELINRERHWRLLAAQVYLENRNEPTKALIQSLHSLACGPSSWGVRSMIRSIVYLFFPGAIRFRGRDD